MSASDVEWRIERAPVAYEEAVARMEQRAAAVAAGDARELVWLLEHPPVITAGTSARSEDLLDPGRYPVVKTGRGGRYTVHGPGQRIAYVVLHLERYGRDVRQLVAAIEDWGIAALAALGVEAGRSPLGTGIWVAGPHGPAKIGAIGVRVRRWVSLHGLAINVSNDLAAFSAIVPCGIRGAGVARLCDLRPEADMPALDRALAGAVCRLVRAPGSADRRRASASAPAALEEPSAKV